MPGDDPPPIPLPRAAVETDAEGRFRVEGIFPGHAGDDRVPSRRKSAREIRTLPARSLRKLVLDDGRTRDVGTVTAMASPL